MTAGRFTLHIEQGASLDQTFKITNPPDNLADHDARMHVRRLYESENADLILTKANGGITLTAEEVRIYAGPSTTASLSHDGVYDIELITPGQEVIRFLEGSVLLSREVTR